MRVMHFENCLNVFLFILYFEGVDATVVDVFSRSVFCCWRRAVVYVCVCVCVCVCVSQAKKTRVLEDEPLHMARLPSCELYELSYMHRDEITHHVMTATDFYVTASKDGFVK